LGLLSVARRLGQAEKKGVKIVGRDRLDPKAADYSAVLTKIQSWNPEAIYHGGVLQAGMKLAKQAYDLVAKMIKGGGDGVQGLEMLSASPARAGYFPAPQLHRPLRRSDFL
jgi:branched-chain amino acid transport system substrate-binding protein